MPMKSSFGGGGGVSAYFVAAAAIRFISAAFARPTDCCESMRGRSRDVSFASKLRA